MSTECSALITIKRPGLLNTHECANGFPVTGSCRGCAGTPVCCNEELAGRLYNEFGGKPPLPISSEAPPQETKEQR